MTIHYADDTIALHHGDALQVLRTLPDNSVDSVVTDLAAGTAAEHLVCADLLLAGLRAFLTDQNCPYDVAVEHERRLIRVQVKSTRSPRTIPQRVGHHAGYIFHVRRAGKGGLRQYETGEFDLYALVALDTRRIAYLLPDEVPTSVMFRAHDDPGPRGPYRRAGRVFDAFPFSRALAALNGGVR